jgi:hypothetical protein
MAGAIQSDALTLRIFVIRLNNTGAIVKTAAEAPQDPLQ